MEAVYIPDTDLSSGCGPIFALVVVIARIGLVVPDWNLVLQCPGVGFGLCQGTGVGVGPLADQLTQVWNGAVGDGAGRVFALPWTRSLPEGRHRFPSFVGVLVSSVLFGRALPLPVGGGPCRLSCWPCLLLSSRLERG